MKINYKHNMMIMNNMKKVSKIKFNLKKKKRIYLLYMYEGIWYNV